MYHLFVSVTINARNLVKKLVRLGPWICTVPASRCVECVTVRVSVHPPLCFCNEQLPFVHTVRLLLFDFRLSLLARHLPCGVLACRLPEHVSLLLQFTRCKLVPLVPPLRRRFMTTSNSAASAAAPAASDSKLDVASSGNSPAERRGAALHPI